MSSQKKNIIISVGILVVLAIFFGIGTALYNPQKEFDKKQAGNIAKTGNLVLAVVQAMPNEVAKTIDVIGEVDQDAVVVNANFASTVVSVHNEGKTLKRGQNVIGFLNGVTMPIPFGGVVSEIFVDIGQNVVAGDKLFVAVPTSSRKTYVKIDLPMVNATVVRNGMPVKIAYNDEMLDGVISNVSIYSKYESGSVKTTVEMEKNSIPHNSVVDVMIEISKHQAFFVPKTAIFLHNDVSSVKIINSQNKVETINIEIIKEIDDGFYISSETFVDNIKVVSVNPMYAEDGVEYKFSIVE
jgi:biotin carboxyl carrier protein